MKKISLLVASSVVIMGISTMLTNTTLTASAATTCQNNNTITIIENSTDVNKTNNTCTTDIKNNSTIKNSNSITNNANSIINSTNSIKSNANSTTKESKKEKKIKKVVKLVNKERAKEGLAPLKLDTLVKKAANVRAKEIVSLFDHKRPNGSGFSTVLTENGVKFNGAGENIAWGQKTAKEVVKAWMNSPGHRANIMNSKFTTIGVGFYKSGGTNYWVQNFIY